MSPFEALYGRPPPRVVDYVPGTAQTAAVDQLLGDRTNILAQLRTNILRAQNRMKQQQDKHRREKSFLPDEWVYLKLQPYRQLSVHRRAGFKLAKRFYGPFKILERIGPVAYRLQLPDGCKIHNVFHVSLLKQCIGDPSIQPLALPQHSISDQPLQQPLKLLGFRQILVHGKPTPQFLVHWEGQLPSEATWEAANDFLEAYPTFNLEDKIVFDGQGNVTGITEGTSEAREELIHATRKSYRVTKKPIKFREFVK